MSGASISLTYHLKNNTNLVKLLHHIAESPLQTWTSAQLAADLPDIPPNELVKLLHTLKANGAIEKTGYQKCTRNSTRHTTYTLTTVGQQYAKRTW